MTQQVSVLVKRQFVRDTLNRLFIYTDQKDWEQVRALFAEQVLFDMTSVGDAFSDTLFPNLEFLLAKVIGRAERIGNLIHAIQKVLKFLVRCSKFLDGLKDFDLYTVTPRFDRQLR